MKKKIAILTQPLGRNYGGIIQNYALQKVLKDLGHEPETINRRRESEFSNLKRFLSSVKKNILKKILHKNIITKSDWTKIYKNNHDFLKKHIQRSKLIETTKELSSYFSQKQFDTVIVGSDQTWRPKYSPDIFNFYLDFLKDSSSIRKIAYASSFGTSNWEYSGQETKICKELIQQFDAVSVREDSGVILCEKYLNAKAVHMLDPALLLYAEDYDQLIDLPKTNTGLFTYVLDSSFETTQFITGIAKELKLDIHKSQGLTFTPKVKLDFKEYIYPPLENWLKGFRDADFIITDSFHGTVFSIIFNKLFISLVNSKRGASRFESLLSQLGLKERLIYDFKDFDKRKLMKSIDYSSINKKLDILKKESLNFLEKNL